ncbi:MAG TPA: hypothetical protein VLB44_27780, partial [Kofleriaceae bacterium]|nr:hypothetical protein [Kofleriaceae bacterium]
IAGKAALVTNTLEDGCDDDGILDSGETAHIKLQVANRGHAMLTDLAMRLTTSEPAVTIVSPPTAIAELAPGGSTELDVEVALEPGRTEPMTSDLALEVTSAGGCDGVVSFPVALRMNVDDRQASSTTDTFDTATSPWVPWTAAWSLVHPTPLTGFWRGEDLGVSSDTRLTSPYLQASPTEPVTLTFQHAHSFEVTDGLYFDGGVIEYSLGTDEVWNDISALVAIPYTATLEADSGNALGGQPAFAGTNPSYPDADTVTLDLGTALADQTFRIRFRIGTDGGAGAPGWDIDNVAFTGLVGAPFPSEVADDGICAPDAPGDEPILSGGGGCCDSRSRTDSGVLSLIVLGLTCRRRRRRSTNPKR